jgi:hypothetical protein
VLAHFHRCGRTGRCSRPYDHNLLTRALLILAPEAVEGRFFASVLAGMAIGRCGRPSRSGRSTPKPWDKLPSLADAEDALGMTVVVVDRPERWTH